MEVSPDNSRNIYVFYIKTTFFYLSSSFLLVLIKSRDAAEKFIFFLQHLFYTLYYFSCFREYLFLLTRLCIETIDRINKLLRPIFWSCRSICNSRSYITNCTRPEYTAMSKIHLVHTTL